MGRLRIKPLWTIEREIEEARQYEQALRVKSRQRSLHGKSIRTPATDTLLKKAGNKWGFGSEKALEDFVWKNISSLLGLTPLERQYSVNGEFCDILARDTSKRLVVLELKNSEDRGIVQQLTRYYVNLMGYKPFKSEVDYSQPARLVAIMPSFHRDNLIDIEYSKLDFDFFELDVIQEESQFYLKLIDITNKEVFQVEIQPSEEDIWNIATNLPEPPSSLKKIIGQCPSKIQEQILSIREKILCFHERIQEITAPGVIKYGRGKSKICAEIRLDSSSNRPFLYLYLPIPDKRRPQPIGERQF